MSNINISDIQLVVALDDTNATLQRVGGKGASLARMAAAGLPVPAGFQITTDAYRRFVAEAGLQAQIMATLAWIAPDQPATLEVASQQIRRLFERNTIPGDIAEAIRKAYRALQAGDIPVAVRSSATAEDLPELSFAGQQDSYLNIQGETQLLQAVKRCWASLWTARAIDYRARYNVTSEEVSLAVVVQELVDADAAGILFTANPLTGARDQVLINAAWGLGEAIVGGHVTPDTVVIDKASGKVMQEEIGEKNVMTVRTSGGTVEQAVPSELRTQAVLTTEQAAELAHIGVRIEDLYGMPMDIEWTLCAGCFAIVQARPITTLRSSGQSPVTEEWNDTLHGDYLWTSGNLGEAVPDVMTPCTWSLMQMFMNDVMVIQSLEGYPTVGNIGGRPYMNLSLLATLARSFGLNRKRFAQGIEQVFGQLPKNVQIPQVALSRWRLLRAVLPIIVRLRLRVRANLRKMQSFLATAAARCDALRGRIGATARTQDLIKLWHSELLPLFHECNQMLEAAGRQDGSAVVYVRQTLRKLVGDTDASAILSGLNTAGNQLESLGPLLGLTQLAHGQIDRATFARSYGHRSAHEFEVSLPRPTEQPEWIEQQLAGLREAPVDVNALLARQKEAQAAAWERFKQRYPRKVASMRRQVDSAAAAFRAREATRSEVIRMFWALRAFVLRAGVLSGQNDDLFFLSIDEILNVLGGDKAALVHVPIRRATYERYAALPTYPTLIRGRFDPFVWATDPQRRSDLFDAGGNHTPASATITGFGGAAGVIEGQVRVLATMDEGDQLQIGEILVTTVTNVGWTPLFPRAAAVVTDVGAPLSHAAIVARELGIPAVVGCGNATMRLHTGDWVRVDGGRGTVEVLRKMTA